MFPSLKGGARTLVRHGAITFGATMAVNVLNYVFHVFGSRMLGPVGYGEIASLLNLLALASIPAAILQLVVAKLVAELRAIDEGERVRAVYDRVLRYTAYAAALILVLGGLLVVPMAGFLHVSNPLPVGLAIAIVAIGIMLTSIRGVLQGAQRFGSFAASLAIESAGKSILGLSLLAAHLGVAGALAGYALGSLCSLAYTSAAVRSRFARTQIPLRLDVRRLWQSSQGIAAMQACLTVLGFSDIVVVKHFFEPAEAGIYSAIALTGKMLLFLVGFVPLLVLPRAATRSAQGQSSRDVILVAAAFLVVASGAVLLVFAAAPEAVIRATSGVAFLAAAPYIVSYGLAMTLLSATQVVATYNVGQHRFGFVIPFGMVTAGELIALTLVPHHIGAIVRVLVVGNLCGLGAVTLPYFSERIFSRFATIAGH